MTLPSPLVLKKVQTYLVWRRVITPGPIFKKMVLNRAQGLKEKSHEVSARKNNNRLRYNKKCRGGGGFRPPALLGLKNKILSLNDPLFLEINALTEWPLFSPVNDHLDMYPIFGRPPFCAERPLLWGILYEHPCHIHMWVPPWGFEQVCKSTSRPPKSPGAWERCSQKIFEVAEKNWNGWKQFVVKYQ